MAFSILSGIAGVTVVAMLLNRNGLRPWTVLFWVAFAAVELVGSGVVP